LLGLFTNPLHIDGPKGRSRSHSKVEKLDIVPIIYLAVMELDRLQEKMGITKRMPKVTIVKGKENTRFAFEFTPRVEELDFSIKEELKIL